MTIYTMYRLKNVEGSSWQLFAAMYTSLAETPRGKAPQLPEIFDWGADIPVTPFPMPPDPILMNPSRGVFISVPRALLQICAKVWFQTYASHQWTVTLNDVTLTVGQRSVTVPKYSFTEVWLNPRFAITFRTGSGTPGA